MMTKFLVLLITMHLAVVVIAQTTNFSVTVQYFTRKCPTKLYLHYNQQTDSAILRKGRFTFKGFLEEPVRATIREPLARFDEQKELLLGRENIKVVVKDSIKRAVIKNSAINELNAEYQAFIRDHKSRYDSLSLVLRSANNDRQKDSTRPIMRQAFSELQQQQVRYVQQYPSSWMSLAAINDLLFTYCMQNVDSATAAARFNPLKKMFDNLDAGIRQTATGESTHKKIENLLNSQVGRAIIPFSQTGHDGALVNTADFKGKYFLVDFWGSWCVWCRKGHPHLKELYNRYQARGFEIIAVSREFGTADEQKKNWLDAIEKDNIGWKHIMVDPKNDLTEHYAIVAYPTKFLIDPDGKIILRVGDDDEKLLDKKLADIYQ